MTSSQSERIVIFLNGKKTVPGLETLFQPASTTPLFFKEQLPDWE
jgi:hypothetical protein